MHQLKRNASNQLGELAEILSDYEMKILYNPYFYRWKMQELHDDKQDLYYKSAGTTDFDSVIGIKSASMSVEQIGEHLVGLGEQVDRLEREYRNRRQILKECTREWQRAAIDDLERYFKQQMTGTDIAVESIEEFKRELYQIEYAARNKRNKVEEKKRDAEIGRKARELQRKREKLHRRWRVNGKQITGRTSSSL